MNNQNIFRPLTGSTQAMFQPGFAGTDAQQVSQQNAQSAHSGSSFQGGFNHFGGGSIGQQSFTGSPQAMFQPGFAGTDAQQVSQQNAQSAQGGSGFQGGVNHFGSQSIGSRPFTVSSQAMFQPGFAGTNAQQVSQQNAQSAQGGSNVQGGFNHFGSQSTGQQSYTGSPQAMFQPGFAGTNAQQVSQQNAQSAQGGSNVQGGFNQFGGQFSNSQQFSTGFGQPQNSSFTQNGSQTGFFRNF